MKLSKYILIVVMLATFILITGMSLGTNRNCSKLYTVKMDKTAADVIYRGTRHITQKNLRFLGYMERCQRNPQAQAHVRSYNRKLGRIHNERIRELQFRSTLRSALASWYYDAGSTASGFHAYYGVANKSLGFGTKVYFSYYGRSVVAVVDDRGPYIGVREWDFNQNTAGALGFSGVGTVYYHIY